jgi:hypothetical protein
VTTGFLTRKKRIQELEALVENLDRDVQVCNPFLETTRARFGSEWCGKAITALAYFREHPEAKPWTEVEAE